MYEWQAQCLAIAGDRNVVYTAPTSAGKSLVADALMFQRLREAPADAFALAIFPFVDLCNERSAHMYARAGKEFQLKRLYGGRGGGAFKRWRKRTIVVCTPERANSIVSQLLELGRLGKMCCVVADEIHMVCDERRGGVIELLLTKIAYAARRGLTKAQIVCMSAPMREESLGAIANWLGGARTYSTRFRPVELRVEIKHKNAMYVAGTGELSRHIPGATDNDHIAVLVRETIDENGSVLVFCPTRSSCEVTAEFLRTSLPGLGVAAHHAGMGTDERNEAQHAFIHGKLRVLCCTSTLAMGVNLPARRVILRSIEMGRSALDARTIQQMLGRAGRKGMDAVGSAIVFCPTHKSPEEVACLIEQGPRGEVRSAVGESDMQRIILDGVACGLVRTSVEMKEYVAGTLSASASETYDLALKALRRCEREGLIAWDGETWTPTKLGAGAALGNLSMDEIKPLVAQIERIRRSLVLTTPLHVVFLLAPSSDRIDAVYRNTWEGMTSDEEDVASAIGLNESMAYMCRRSHAQTLRQFACARVVTDLIEERGTIEEIAARFGTDVGRVQWLQEACAMRAQNVCALCEACGWDDVATLVTRTAERVLAGSKADILELTRIPCVGVHRARALARAGVRTPDDILDLGSPEALACVLRERSKNTHDAFLVRSARRIFSHVEREFEEKLLNLDYGGISIR